MEGEPKPNIGTLDVSEVLQGETECACGGRHMLVRARGHKAPIRLHTVPGCTAHPNARPWTGDAENGAVPKAKPEERPLNRAERRSNARMHRRGVNQGRRR